MTDSESGQIVDLSAVMKRAEENRAVTNIGALAADLPVHAKLRAIAAIVKTLPTGRWSLTGCGLSIEALAPIGTARLAEFDGYEWDAAYCNVDNLMVSGATDHRPKVPSALTIACPRCDAAAGVACQERLYGLVTEVADVEPHDERARAVRGDGAPQEARP